MNVQPGQAGRRAAAPADVPEGADRARVPGSAPAVPAVARVAVFSLTFPATACALEGMGPWTVTTVRAVLTAVIAGVVAVAVPGCVAVAQRAGR